MSNYYFGYGSNLSSQHRLKACGPGVSSAGMCKVDAAWLPDHELVFNRLSKKWKGGVLNVQEKLGQLVPGILFKIDAHMWNLLDQKEGNAYERFATPILLSDGTVVQAESYRVRAGFTASEGYEEPTAEYLAVVRSGYGEHELPDIQLERAALNLPVCPEVDGLFFYGTLLRGECRFSVVAELTPVCILLAHVFGTVLDLGPYPGLQLHCDNENMAQGEFVRFSDINAALKALDLVEGFHGWGQPGNLFERRLVQVGLKDGRVRLAWVYVYTGKSQSAPKVPCGDWREHQGRLEKFLDLLVRKHIGEEEEKVAAILAQSPFLPAEDLESVTKSLLPLATAIRTEKISERELAQVSGQWAVHVKESELV